MNKKIRLFLTISCYLLVSIVLSSFLFTDYAVKTSANAIHKKPTIILDAGHGGEDSGAIVKDVLEKDINLKIALKTKVLFEVNGFNVKLTRDSDSDTDSESEKFIKTSDLNNRVKLFNSSPDNIVISIHQNKFTETQYKGAQIFYSDNNEKSAVLAENIRKSIISLLQNENTRECKKVSSDIYILDNSSVPSILVECGFLSNPEELKNLNDDKYQTKFAYCLFLGFLEYYNVNY